MASEAQFRANRRNAARSTGPRTAAGKSKARFNALKHGLAAGHVVLAEEDFAAYHGLRSDLIMEYTPQSPSEGLLVDLLAQHMWRLHRIRRYETGTFGNLNPADVEDSPEYPDLDALRRYETSISRDLFRVYDRLQRILKNRPEPVPDPEPLDSPVLETPPEIAAPAALHATAAPIVECSEPPQNASVTPVGFVLQNSSDQDPPEGEAPAAAYVKPGVAQPT